MNPLKAFVYAGCGVPTVTTEIANLPDLGTAIRTAATSDEILDAVCDLVDRRHDLPAPPRDLLERHTWPRRIVEIEHILDAAGDHRSGSAQREPVLA